MVPFSPSRQSPALRRVLAAARLEGIPVIRLPLRPEDLFHWNLVAMSPSVYVEKHVVAVHGDPPARLLPWFLLHELGHVMQMRSGYLTPDLLAACYESDETKRTPRTRAIERDAWRRAGRLARKHAVVISDEARAAGRRALRTYDDQ